MEERKMTEIEKIEGEIKVLQAKLELLKEMENHKSRAEVAYKDWEGKYPGTEIWTSDDDMRWVSFAAGYNAAQKDYKVGEYQPTPQKSPAEEAFKRVYCRYPDKYGSAWDIFEKGYARAQKDYKVGEYQPTPQEPKERKTLYQRFGDEGAYGSICFPHAVEVVRGFLMDEGVIKYEDEEYITITLQKSLLEVTND